MGNRLKKLPRRAMNCESNAEAKRLPEAANIQGICDSKGFYWKVVEISQFETHIRFKELGTW